MAKPTGGSFEHEPVMLAEVIDNFQPVPSGTVVDATLGGAGHAAALLASRSDLSLVGIDQDPAAVAASSQRLGKFGDRVRVVRSRFDRLGAVLESLEVDDLVGALFDLGVSSPQLDLPERGFSYRADGPLDMRMDPESGSSAHDLINDASSVELARILREFADERFASRIANAIVAARPVVGTLQLADIVRDAIPAPARRTGGHPAKRTFQALRIAVNAELEQIDTAITQAIDHLVVGGRGAVLTYHSGEDRIAKAVLRDNEVTSDAPRGMPVEIAPTGNVVLLKRGGLKATAEEQATNPRSTSARLRCFEKVAVAA